MEHYQRKVRKNGRVTLPDSYVIGLIFSKPEEEDVHEQVLLEAQGQGLYELLWYDEATRRREAFVTTQLEAQDTIKKWQIKNNYNRAGQEWYRKTTFKKYLPADIVPLGTLTLPKQLLAYHSVTPIEHDGRFYIRLQ